MKSLLYIVIIISSLLEGTFYSYGQIQNNGNFRMHSKSQMGFFGDFTNEGSFDNNLGTLYATGSQAQIFSGTNVIQTNNFNINKESESLHLNNVLRIDSILTFNKGRITTDRSDITTEYVEFQDDAIYVSASDSSHIDGVIRKIGNDDFIFPTGDSNMLRTISISAPSSVSDHFTAYYTENDPDNIYSRSSLDIGIDHVSACEYWILNRTGGGSNVAVSLSWDTNSCGIDNLCDLLVSRWDGAQWTSEGNGGVTGTTATGTLVSGTDCTTPASVTNFSPFTLASISGNNPLPISLILFEAQACERSVCLSWQTESETNNDYFTVEKSEDGVNWKLVKDVEGAGNSNSILNYETIDKNPYSGISYYRLKQTDFNGEFEYTEIRSVNFKGTNDEEYTIYPNPSKDIITISGLISEKENFKYYNSMGQEVTSFIKTLQRNNSSLQLDISELTKGVYYIRTENIYESFIKI